MEGELAMTAIDANRARLYRLLAVLLARPPDAETLATVAGIGNGPGVLGAAIGAVADAARTADPEEAKREYDRLFIGLNRGEVVPYASWYRTGFLQDRPLIAVRATLETLGLARGDKVPEPEDHAAAMLEAMAVLIEEGKTGDEAQRSFFETHLKPWISAFFADLAAAESARLYAPVGLLGVQLMTIESEAFELS